MAAETGLSKSDSDFLAQCLNHAEGTVTINAISLAKDMGYSNPKSVANRICALKKKLGIEMCVSLSGANKAGAASNSTAASGPIDATKVRKPPTPKKQPTTPRKPRAKSVNKKSAAEPSQYGAASHTNNASVGEPGVEGGPRMKTDESEEDETEVA